MQDIQDDDEEGLIVNYHLETRITRVVGNMIVPSKIKLRADVETTEGVTDFNLSLALSKIKYFFETIVPKCIVYSADNGDAMDMFIDPTGRNRTSNQIMTTPADPTDEVLSTVFQAKMNALADGAIVFPMLEVRADNQLGLSFCFFGNALAVLPSNEDWIGSRSYFDKPWWERNDASTIDVVPPPDADLSKRPAWAYSLDVLQQPKADTGIVVRPDFRPTVISGGKKTPPDGEDA